MTRIGGILELKRKIKNPENVTVNLNGKKVGFKKEYITYSDICRACMKDENCNPSITYKCKSDSGILTHDEEVYAVEGMVINCHYTGNA